LFDAQMRADPPVVEGARIERTGSVVRSVGLWNIVLFWDRDSRDPRSLVATQANAVRANGLALEWKLYSHDGPEGLATALRDERFVPDAPETLMMFDLTGPLPDTPLHDGLEIRTVVDVGGVRDHISVSSAAFGEDLSSRTETYVRALGDPTLALYVAYLRGQPVSCGRLQLPADRAFASLWGGATVPGHRGLGIYRALVAFRANVARRHGYRYLTIDARETSRPILARLGFVPLSGVTAWMLRPDGATSG
jgi:GNAT superfamily N-acetyltransferase